MVALQVARGCCLWKLEQWADAVVSRQFYREHLERLTRGNGPHLALTPRLLAEEDRRPAPLRVAVSEATELDAKYPFRHPCRVYSQSPVSSPDGA